jgi:DNA (cytosine-5)-methyltransferase 1
MHGSEHPRPTYGSLCTGYGGLDLAIEAVFGARPLWHFEIEPAATTVLEHHWPGFPNHHDLTTADWNELPPVDVLCGGYPCQPFSTAGRRLGAEDDRHLWPHIADALRVLRPRWAVFENVAGHVSLGFDRVLADLASLGFDAEWVTVRASDVGAPHRRERLFILARNASHVGHERSWDARRRWDGSADDGGAAADADGDLRRWFGGGVSRPVHGQENAIVPSAEHAGGTEAEGWGPYAAAISRWEHATGRTAPDPTTDGRLSSRFVEWMMGLPDEWVTGHSLSRTAELKMLGNGVVPQQAVHAIGGLLARMDVGVAA